MRSLVGLALLAVLVLAAAAQTAPDAFAPVLTVADVDVAACRAWTDGQEVPGAHREGVLAALGLGKGNGWAVGRRDQGKSRDYLIVLRRPVALGSLLFQQGGTLKLLKPGAALPPDPAAAAAWDEVAFPASQSGWRLAALPPGTATQAFFCSLAGRRGDWHCLATLRLFRPRLHNVVPEALANGEAEYVSYGDLRAPVYFLAANLVRGSGAWQSHGPDAQSERIPRAPVSDVAPTWFVISWEREQTVGALLLAANFKKFQLLAYGGAPDVNPVIAGEQDWTRVKYSVQPEAGAQRLVFAPLKTRAFKLVATDTGARFGRIDALQAWIDLGTGPVPARAAAAAAPPFSFPVALPCNGSLSLAIDDAHGLRQRNLFARVDRPAGNLDVAWDLRGDDGKFVAPGTYRWQALVNPGLQLQYQLTPYPNIAANAPENSPWLNGAEGPGGWLADHSSPSAVCPVGDRVFLSAPCAESGVALIDCDLAGRKAWGHHNIIAWTGPSLMASDGRALYCLPRSQGHYELQGRRDYVWRFSLPEKKLDTMLDLSATATRRRGVQGVAARDGKLYLAIDAKANWLEGACTAGDVDLDHCEPHYNPPPKTNKYDDPDRRADFLRLLRLSGTPPGCKGLITLETAEDDSPRHYLVIAFDKPVPLGSLVFPAPEDAKIRLQFSALTANGSYPPKPKREKDWKLFWKGQASGWTVIPAPENLTTRALRIGFDQGLDELDEAALKKSEEDDGPGFDNILKDKNDAGLAKPQWKATLEGLKLLRRRFANVFPSCKVTVNSGKLAANGEWDAQREQPLTRANPGLYMMSWEGPQALRGVAIKEIDGRFTEIDAWTGAGAPDLAAETGWENLATYEQPTRYYYQPDQNHNSTARYLDGYVDFGREVQTRALRLRVVEQWLWKDEGRGGAVGVRKDRGGQDLDPVRCRIYGVAPLVALGGEPPSDPLASNRLEVWDVATKKLAGEWPLAAAGDLVLGPRGELYAVSGNGVVQMNPATGQQVPLKLEVGKPRALACDRAGNLYVFDAAPEQRVVQVFDPAGKRLRTIGTPGGRVAGPWDPTRFTSRPGIGVDLAVDSQDQLWIVEQDTLPKRVSLWTLDGTLKRDFFGNTSYGGGGCLDPYDKTRLFYGAMEFALDWQSGSTAMKNITWLGNSPPGEQPLKVQERLYLVTRPLFETQAVGVVYLYEQNRLRRVAAMGRAGNFEPLRTPAILKSLGRRALGEQAFVWSDRNGDGDVQPEEAQFFPSSDPRHDDVIRFEETLAVDAGAWRYEVTGFLPTGAPVYERRRKAFSDRSFRTDAGPYFLVGNDTRMGGLAADGKPVWTHPTEGWGVHALTKAKPWFPGQTVAQFGLIGHETAPVGGLGEFFVTHSNTGAWHLWTADGLLAGRLFRDMRSPGTRPWSMREHERGLDLTDVTCGQEHFNGYFCRSRADNKYYVVAGHNHVSVVEVLGIDRIVRLRGEVTVTPEDVKAALEWDRKTVARQLYEAGKIMECRRSSGPIKIDGDPGEWDGEGARLPNHNVGMSLCYDDTTLYLCCQARGLGPLRNSGNDWRRLFKTGAALDLQIGSDPAAPAARSAAVPGDSRLLMTFVKGEPVAVLYQPNAPGAKPDENWETHTLVFRAEFDRVAKVSGVRQALREIREGKELQGYCFEAAIPLAALGLKPQPDLRLKLDWGLLVSGPDGTETFQRLYWANAQTAIVSDEAAEAMLHPELWGYVRFAGKPAKEGFKGGLDVDKATKGGLGDLGDLKLDE